MWKPRRDHRIVTASSARWPTSVEGNRRKLTAPAAGSRSSFCSRGGLEILLEKVVEKCSDHRDGAELAEVSPGWGDNAANDVGCQLEFETEQQPHPEALPDRLALPVRGANRRDHPQQPDKGFERRSGDDDDRRDLAQLTGDACQATEEFLHVNPDDSRRGSCSS